MNTASTESQSVARSYHRRATPWGVRILLGVSILFGIWVDVSNIPSSVPNTSSKSASPISADRNQIRLLGLNDEPSTVGTIVKTLASRRS